MFIKKGILIFIPSLVFLVSCNNNDQIIKNEENISVSSTQEDLYQIKQPVKFNVSRGLILNNIDNSLDINNIEMELMQLSTKYFPVDKYTFQEGQYLDKTIINQWLERKGNDAPSGLNPPKNETGDVLKDEQDNPKILSHVLEQNFLNKNGKIKGISLAISLNEFYNIQVADKKGLIHTDEVKVDVNNDDVNDVEKYGKEITNKIIKDIRNNKDIPDVPIFLTLYQETHENNIIPGMFLAETFIPKGQNQISKWTNIDKRYYAFPSNSLSELDRISSNNLTNFKEDIQKYFKNLNPKVFGRLLYKTDQLTNLKIDVSTPTITDVELIALLQFISTRINSLSSDYTPITVSIIDEKQTVGIVTWDPTKKEIYTHAIQ
ncbi:CamS family sex pheromone protein [Viridibacillus sp. NPDC093762]|uniref:CamS family sex pheromone protein n=1 Tax=Viridibacillus sp. NPDC093762 TaxID=3390720 RepID=UPI003D00620D